MPIAAHVQTICPTSLCKLVEERANCSMGYRSPRRRACLPSLLLADELLALRNCSVCGTEHRLHRILSSNSPLFPSRQTHAYCEIPDKPIEAPASSAELESSYEHAELVARQSALDACVCTVHGTGTPETIQHWLFPSGFSHITHMCPFGAADAASVRRRRQLSFRPHPLSSRHERVGVASGGKHLVLAGALRDELEDATGGAAMANQGELSSSPWANVGAQHGAHDAIVRIAMTHLSCRKGNQSGLVRDGCGALEGCTLEPADGEGKGEGNTTVAPRRRLHCRSPAGLNAYRSICSRRLMRSAISHTIDLPTQAALGGLTGFPDLLGGGCCVYEIDTPPSSAAAPSASSSATSTFFSAAASASPAAPHSATHASAVHPSAAFRTSHAADLASPHPPRGSPRGQAKAIYLLPIEARRSFFPRNEPRNRDRYGQLRMVEADATRVPQCEDNRWSEAECALRRALASARLLRELHETRHRVVSAICGWAALRRP